MLLLASQKSEQNRNMTDLFGMPLPRNISIDGATLLPLPARFDVTDAIASARVVAAVERLNGALADCSETGALALTVRNDMVAERPALEVAEDYQLQIEATGVTLTATTDIGALHGLHTLQQMLFAQNGLPIATVTDQPRYPWRGLLLDVARHYLSIESLQRTLSCMAAAKLNVLHLHLTDDQGFRFRSAKYPRLASCDAYSGAELHALVAYADRLGVRVVPELDMPGHVTSWLQVYPEWGTQAADPSLRFGVHSACLNPVDEQVHRAIEDLIEEVAAIFPDDYLHIGGDEVHPSWWQSSPELQAHMQTAGLADVAALQAQFNLRVADTLQKHGRRMLVWDEALHPLLNSQAQSITVQNWRGATTRDRALTAGHPCIVSAGYYLDLHYPAHWHYRYDPGASQDALLALEDELLSLPAYAHVADGMRWTHQWRTDAVAEVATDAPVLGGEACQWGELVDDGTIDTRLWTRLPAIAERLWSTDDVTAIDAMYERLDRFTDFLEKVSLNDLEGRLASQLEALGIDANWQPLVQWLEPVKWYGRLLGEAALAARLQGTEMPKARPYQADTPLNQLIDYLPVESRSTRVLAADLERRGPAAALPQWVQHWQSLCQRNDCPVVLQAQRAQLATLAQLVARRLTGATLNSTEHAQLAALHAAQDDLLLAPVFALRDWLGQS